MQTNRVLAINLAGLMSVSPANACSFFVAPEGATPTQNSNIYDLVNLRVYLYHFHNLEEVIIFDLPEEFAKGIHESPIRDLFNDTFMACDYRTQ